MTDTKTTTPTTPVPMFGFEDAAFEEAGAIMRFDDLRSRLKASEEKELTEMGRPGSRYLGGVVGGWYALPQTGMIELYDLPARGDRYAGGDIVAELPPEFPMRDYFKAVCDVIASFHLEAMKAQAMGEITRPLVLSRTRGRGKSDLRCGNWITLKKRILKKVLFELSKSKEDMASADAGWNKWVNKLDSFEALEPGWDSYCAPAPTPDTIAKAKGFLKKLRESRTPPDRLAPAVVGGIGFTFKRQGLKVYVEFSNKGSVHALFSDGVTDPVVDKIQPDDAGYSELILRVKTYLHE